MKTSARLVIGNWKMNPRSISDAKKLFTEVKKATRRNNVVDIVVAPPSLYLSELQRLLGRTNIMLGAQNAFYENLGARTGEVSPLMFKSTDVRYVIVGHSERRALGETNDDVAKKISAIITHGMTAVVCVGEQKRNARGDHFTFVEQQVHSALQAVAKNKIKQLVIAYEPIWAIGTGDTATPDDVQEMRLFIQKIVADHFTRKATEHIRILYGGSVNKHNAEDILHIGMVDGFLVGGASLKAAEFGAIVATAQSV